jgi:hypothetical protein
MASGGPARPGPEERLPDRARWRRRLLTAQGVYYILTGLWPLVHFSSYADAIALPLDPFRSQTLAAVMVVVGGSLIEATRRGAPGPFPTLLGAAVAGAVGIVSLWWLPRAPFTTALWVDLFLEIGFALTLVLLYPRPQEERSPPSARRR